MTSSQSKPEVASELKETAKSTPSPSEVAPVAAARSFMEAHAAAKAARLSMLEQLGSRAIPSTEAARSLGARSAFETTHLDLLEQLGRRESERFDFLAQFERRQSEHSSLLAQLGSRTSPFGETTERSIFERPYESAFEAAQRLGERPWPDSFDRGIDRRVDRVGRMGDRLFDEMAQFGRAAVSAFPWMESIEDGVSRAERLYEDSHRTLRDLARSAHEAMPFAKPSWMEPADAAVRAAWAHESSYEAFRRMGEDRLGLASKPFANTTPQDAFAQGIERVEQMYGSRTAMLPHSSIIISNSFAPLSQRRTPPAEEHVTIEVRCRRCGAERSATLTETKRPDDSRLLTVGVSTVCPTCLVDLHGQENANAILTDLERSPVLRLLEGDGSGDGIRRGPLRLVPRPDDEQAE